MLLLLLACADPAQPPPQGLGPDACDIMSTPAPGPLAIERDKVRDDPLGQARLRIREARLTGDPGFYTLAESALDCALLRSPEDAEAKRLRVHLLIQFHRFAEAEVAAKALLGGPTPSATFLDYALYGDALMEQGELDAAGVAYQSGVDIRPGLEMYDRIGWLRWLWGDVPGALEMQALAVSAGSSRDPEPFAWVLTRMGWLHVINGQPAPEIEQALSLLPDYPPARFARGRIRLQAGDSVGAAQDLRVAGRTVEAVRALAEAAATDLERDPVDVNTVGRQDPRGYAIWLADSDSPPDRARAVGLLETELKSRHDAVTRMALAWARHRSRPGGADVAPEIAAEVAEILATGIVEPRVLLQAGLIQMNTSLLQRALDSGPGLLPSEQKRAQEALSEG